MIKSINPYSQELLAQYSHHTSQEVNHKLTRSQKAFIQWQTQDISTRSQFATNMQKLLLDNIEVYANLMSLEMGKPINQAKAEVEKCSWLCEYYAKNSQDFLSHEHIETQYYKSYISYQPMGVILGIMPWNFPFWQVIRFAIPTLLAGNTVILKHASNVPQCAIILEELFLKSGFPSDCFQNIFYTGKQTQSIIHNPIIQGISLTGSSQVGVEVAVESAKTLKHCVLELGGSDPYIILEDANLSSAAKACVTSRFINSGQSCIAAKRIIVHQNIYDDFIQECLYLTRQFQLGNPVDENTDIGPLARLDLCDEVKVQVQTSVEQGATLLYQAPHQNSSSSIYPPSILIDVTEDMMAFKQEIFGPVMSVIKADNEKHAIELANNSDFGLGAAIFSQDIARAEKIAKTQLLAGCCSVNDFVKSDPRLPFGGIKLSGQGRELSHLALREFCHLKTIVVNS